MFKTTDMSRAIPEIHAARFKPRLMAAEDQMALRQVNAPRDDPTILHKWPISFFGARRLP